MPKLTRKLFPLHTERQLTDIRTDKRTKIRRDKRTDNGQTYEQTY